MNDLLCILARLHANNNFVSLLGILGWNSCEFLAVFDLHKRSCGYDTNYQIFLNLLIGFLFSKICTSIKTYVQVMTLLLEISTQWMYHQ